MSLFVWPPQNINTTGLATEAKQDVTNTKLDTLHTDTAAVTTRLNQMGAAFFTKAFDEIVPTTDATHDIYTSKLATVTQQTLTITYSDATKSTVTSYKVV